MQTESGPWLFEPNALQHPRLQSIQERPKSEQRTPLRTPSRMSSVRTPSIESEGRSHVSSSEYPLSPVVPSMGVGTRESTPDTPMEGAQQTSSNFTYRISDASTKAKAYASLGIGSPRNTKTIWEDWSNNSNSPNADGEAPTTESLRGKRLAPLNPMSPLMNDEFEETEMTDSMELLSFSQDYHDVLADQYQEANTRRAASPIGAASPAVPAQLDARRPQMSSKDHDLMPEPLTWRRGRDGQSQDNLSRSLPSRIPPTLTSREKHKRITSWASLRHLKNGGRRSSSNDEVRSHSTSNPAVPHRHIPKLEVDRLLRNKKLIPNFASHTRGFKAPKRRAKAVVSVNTDESPVPSSESPASPPLKRHSPLIRLPGGFALVRHSPSTNPHPESPSMHDVSPDNEDRRRDSSVGSPVSASDNPRRRSSCYSQHSQPAVAPAMAVNPKVRSSFGFPPSPQSRTDDSPPPNSPLAHEVPLPRTPPPLPLQPPRVVRLPSISSPLPLDRGRETQQQRAEGVTDEDFLGPSIMNKARNVRDAWKKHQREVKHDKLKQSIRILGPTDPTVAAGYVKREGRQSGDDGSSASGRMPGYMVTGSL